jgi:hypothetical protein
LPSRASDLKFDDEPVRSCEDGRDNTVVISVILEEYRTVGQPVTRHVTADKGKAPVVERTAKLEYS